MTTSLKIKRSASGKIIPKRFSVERLERAADENMGFCVACGASKDACEPDARRYPCDDCGLSLVFGAEEIALSGWTK